VALIGAGYADFALIAYHFGQAEVVAAPLIPILYAVAMASDGVSALVLGRLFDRRGMVVLMGATAAAALAAPLVFLAGAKAAWAGMILWGVGTGAQESVMRAVVARMAPPDRRGTAYGILNAVFGVAWFSGSVLLGVVYDYSVVAVAVLSLVLQFLALPFLAIVARHGASVMAVQRRI
jgi:MFS family permease